MRSILTIGLLLFLTACEQSSDYTLAKTEQGLYRFNEQTGDLVLVDGDILRPVSEFPVLELTGASESKTDDFQYKFSANSIADRIYFSLEIFHSPDKEWRESQSRLEFNDRISNYNYTIKFVDAFGNILAQAEAKDRIQNSGGMDYSGSLVVSRQVIESVEDFTWSFNITDFDGDLTTKTLDVAFSDLIKDKPATP